MLSTNFDMKDFVNQPKAIPGGEGPNNMKQKGIMRS